MEDLIKKFEELDAQFKKTCEICSRIDKQLDSIESKLSSIEGKLDQLESTTNAGFSQMNDDLNGVYNKITTLVI